MEKMENLRRKWGNNGNLRHTMQSFLLQLQFGRICYKVCIKANETNKKNCHDKMDMGFTCFTMISNELKLAQKL
jgi:hypothetical protein